MDRYKAAVIQLTIEQGNKEKNIENALRWVDVACEEGARVACLPEYFSTGYPGRSIPQVAEPIPGPTIDVLAKKAAQKKIVIVSGSIVEMGEKGFHNTS